MGGANLDVKARSGRRAVAATSNPGHTSLSPGGVGRNIAENLARLGTPVHLVAAVGTDPLGDLVLTSTAAAGVGVDHVRRTPGPTGTYTAVLDSDGELVVAVADMAATDALGPDDVDAARDLLDGAALVVLDGNLGVPALTRALEVSADAGVPVLLEPVSVPKAALLRPVLSAGAGARRLFALTPNRDELAALVGPDGGAAELHALGVEHVWVRLGPSGSLLCSPGGTVELASVDPGEVVDVTGAGDAMLAAFCHGVLSGASPAEAAALGHAAAALTVASEHTVRPDLTDELLRSVRP